MSSPTAAVQSPSGAPGAVAGGQTINSQTFQQMLTILNDLTDHSHTVYDDYTSVCQCQCQCQCACACACGRGIV